MPAIKTSRFLLAAAGALLVLAPVLVLASEHGAAAGGGGGVSHDQLYNFIYRVMNFAVLVAVLIVVLRKPLKSGLGSRVESIKEELAELEAKREEARRELAVMEQRLKDAESEGEGVLKEFRAMGEKEMAKIIEGATSLAERIKAQAQFTIETETAAAKAELKREVAEMSASLAEDLLKKNITADDQTRLVDEYLAKVQQEVQ